MLDDVRMSLQSILQAADTYTAGHDFSNVEVQTLILRCASAMRLTELAAVASGVVEFIPPYLSDQRSDFLHALLNVHDNPPKDEEEEAELLDTLAAIY